MRADHVHDCFEMPKKCCSNIKRKNSGGLFGSSQAMKDLGDSPQGQSESMLMTSKNLRKINSFTLSGSGLHFELNRDPTELIGSIFWQLKRIKIEKYEPIVVGGRAFLQEQSAHDLSSQKSTGSTQAFSSASPRTLSHSSQE